MPAENDIDSLADTLEILGNQDTATQIKESIEDIQLGRTREVNFVKDLN